MRIAGRLDSWQGGCADLRCLKEFRLGGLKYISDSQQTAGKGSQLPAFPPSSDIDLQGPTIQD